jgi:pimeloyl-ACP methyl ester carboxylesterase
MYVSYCLAMADVDHVTVTVGGRELWVEDAGPPGGFPVVVAHGTPGSRHLFRGLVRVASQNGLRMIGYDRPGYAGSTAQPGRVVADCAGDVTAVASQLGIRRLALWGVSGGGPCALACAALLPDLVTAACVFASIGPYGGPGLDYLEGMGESENEDVRLFFEDRAQAREKFRADAAAWMPGPGVAEALLDRWGDLAETDAAHSREFAEDLVLGWREGMSAGDQGWWDDEVSHLSAWGFDVDAIRVPVQLWHGRADTMVPLGHGQWLAGQIPGVDAHFPEADDHGVEANHCSEACEWLKQV